MSTPGRLSTADLAKADERRAMSEQAEVPAAEATRAQSMPAPANEEPSSPLFADDTSGELWRQWDAVQGGFVDEPRRAVEEADMLVADTMKRLAETFARERDTLEQQWARGSDVSTEDLRVALQRYRSFFKRLLSV
jgi:hypothetical protein